MQHYFITATDTDAGKTYVAQALVCALVMQGQKVAVYKPVAAGCELINNQWVNEDARLLTQLSNCGQTIAQVNPITFAEPIAPHIAAHKSGKAITLADIQQGFKQLDNTGADIAITEGAGGWRLPLGSGKYLSEFVQANSLKVVLVVNMKLGCLNHAILTYESIINDGVECIGWVANCPEEMSYQTENIQELEALLPVPKIAQLNFATDIEQAAAKFDLSPFK